MLTNFNVAFKMAGLAAKGLWHFCVCGHLKRYPTIKVSPEPQTPPPFLSTYDVDIHTIHSKYPPISVYFWVQHCRGDDLCFLKTLEPVTSNDLEIKLEASDEHSH